MISPALVAASVVEEIDEISSPQQITTTLNQCKICQESFGKIMNRRTICFKCKYSFCHTHSNNQRWNLKKKQLCAICDQCINNEHKIHIKQRLKNLKLKHFSDGTYINKISKNSFEYKLYQIRKDAKIIQINDKNVESFAAQPIANTLNSIPIPFDITLDFTKCENNNTTDSETSYDSPTIKRRHSIHKTIGFGTPLSDKSMQRILDHMTQNKDLVTADSSTTSTTPSINNSAFDGVKICKSLSPVSKPTQSAKSKTENQITEISELKTDLVELYSKMNAFNKKYNTNKLDTIFNEHNNRFKEMECELDQAHIENNKFQRRLDEIGRYKMSQKLDFDKPLYNINEIIEWIVLLENGRFNKYKNKLRFGFEKLGIYNGYNLGNIDNITQSCLNGNVFKIYNLNDCKDLAKYFKQFHERYIMKSNHAHVKSTPSEGMQSELNKRNWFGIYPVKSMMNACSMFIEGS